MYHVVIIVTIIIIAILILHYSIMSHATLIFFYHISMLTLHITCTLIVTSMILWSLECKKQRPNFIESRYLARYKRHLYNIWLLMHPIMLVLINMQVWLQRLLGLCMKRERGSDWSDHISSKTWMNDQRLQKFWRCPRIVAWVLMIGMHAKWVWELQNTVWETAGPINEQGKATC